MPNLKIDDRDYDLDTLPTEIKTIVAHVQAIDLELTRLQAQSAIHQTARAAYSRTLRDELKKLDDAADQKPAPAAKGKSKAK
jgi:hypothetical protein